MEEKRYYVYGYLNMETNAYFYIGKGTHDRYLELSCGRNDEFKKIISSDKDICVEILYDNLTELEAYDKEFEVIDSLVFEEGYTIGTGGMRKDPNKHLVNKCLGGFGTLGFEWKEESKKKLSESRKGIKLSDTTKHKLSELNKGEKNPNYGIKRSQETKDKISKSNKGKIRTKEWIHNLSESHKGLPNFNRKPVYCIELDEYFPSGDQAIAEMKKRGYKCANLKMNCNGKRPYAGTLENGTKLHWRWASNDEYTPATTE